MNLTETLFGLPGFGFIYDIVSFPFVSLSNLIMGSVLEGKVKEENTALEIGAGTGAVSAFLANRFRLRITAIDASKGMLDVAKIKSVDSRVRFLVGRAEELPVSGPFDLIVASYLLRHIKPEDTGKFLSEVRRVSKAGTWLILNDLSLPPIGPHVGKRQILGVWTLYDPVSLVRLVEGYGFNYVESHYPPLSIMLVFRR